MDVLESSVQGQFANPDLLPGHSFWLVSFSGFSHLEVLSNDFMCDHLDGLWRMVLVHFLVRVSASFPQT